MNRAGQQGYVLFTVVVMLFIVAATAYLVGYDSTFKASQPEGELEAARADYVVDAAMQHALWQNANNYCSGDFQIAASRLGPDSYAATASGGAPASSVTLFVDQDSYIKNYDPSANEGANASLHVQNELGQVEQALYRFDLSPLAPNAQINSAIGWFYLRNGGQHPEGPVTIHRVTKDWVELGASWQSLDETYEASPVAAIPAQDTDGVWVQVNLTAQVQAWVNGAANHGVIFRTEAEGVHAQYSSREDGGNAPRLTVAVGNGAITPLSIEATGRLVSGVSRTLTRSNVPARQPPTRFASPIGADLKDTFVDSTAKSTNYGTRTYLKISDDGLSNYALIDFTMAPIPAGVRVVSAELSLYLESLSAAPADAVLNAYRVWQPWTENGATYLTSDGTSGWQQAGNGRAANPDMTAPMPTLAPGWVTIDVGAAFADWAAGTSPNYGIALSTANGVHNAIFTSSDALDPSRHPRLMLTFACDCGSTCLMPQSIGDVLLVVEKDTSLSPHEASIKASIESWGYDVTLISGDSLQLDFDIAAGLQDVIFVADTAVASASDKLDDMPIGVVSMQGSSNKSLGLADDWSPSVDSVLNIVDSAHYITQPFIGGALPIYRANMEGIGVTGAEAPDLQTLGEWKGAGGLVVLDKGRQSMAGTAPGRRVLLPMGRNKDTNFDWSFLSLDGMLIAQRSIEWALGPRDAPGADKLLMVVRNPYVLTVQEAAKLALVETYGYSVSLIDESATQVDFDIALVDTDVVYLTSEVDAGKVGSKLAKTAVGVVTEEAALADEFGFSDAFAWDKFETSLTIDNGHYITEPLASGSVGVYVLPNDLAYLTGELAPGLQTIGEIGGKPGLALLEAGVDSLLGVVPGRRVVLPWGSTTLVVSLLTPNALTMFQRSLAWAAGAGTAATEAFFLTTESNAILGGLSFTDRDIVEYRTWNDTGSLFFNGGLTALANDIDALHVLKDGLLLLSSAGDTTLGGVAIQDGDLVVYDPASDTAVTVFDGSTLFSDPTERLISVHVLDNGHYLLSTASDARLGGLSFDDNDLVEYDPVTGMASLYFDGSATTLNSEITAVHVQDNGHIFLSPGSDTTLGGRSISAGDLVDYDPVADTAVVVFAGAARFDDPRDVIMSAHIGPGSGSVGCMGTFRDEFNSVSYSGNHGTLEWTGDWIEIGESNGPDAGDIRVFNNVSDFQLRTRDSDNGGEGVEREANLNGAGSATLSYDYRRLALGSATDYTKVEISANGAIGPWTELARFSGPAHDAAYQRKQHDITSYASPSTRIRFITGPATVDSAKVFFDNIEIACNL